MGFFGTDIELLPSSRYDAGVDQWNKIYLDLKKKLIVEFGSAGKSPRTGNNMPAVPYGVAIALSVQFATELAKLIALFVEQQDEPMLVPVKLLKSDQTLYSDFSQAYGIAHTFTGGETEVVWFHNFDKKENRLSWTLTWLGADVVRENYQTYPNPGELRNPAFQRLLEPNWRLVNVAGERKESIVVTTRQDMDERHWLRPAVRAYQELIWNAWDLHSLSAGGPIKPLTAFGADLFLKRIYAATQWLAIRIPVVTADDIITFAAKRSTEVVEQAAGTAANALDWATKTAAGAVNEAIGELDIFTWLVLGSIGAVYLAVT
jgi:hypothetical protein